MISPAQIKAARALVGLTQKDLASAARVSEVSVKNIERGATDPRVSTIEQIKHALERHGAVFVPENGGGAGVRLFKEPLVGWWQCKTPFPGDFPGIQIPFEALFLARGAPEEMALFSRTDESRAFEVFLLSAGAAPHRNALRGDWRRAENPSLFGWALLVGRSGAHQRLGLRAARDGRAA